MKKKTSKAYFVQRLIAFMIDILLVYTVASLVATPFIDTKESEKITEEISELINQTTNQEITTREFADRNMDLSYQMARKNGFISLISIIVNILYFVVFQLYNKGQTIGKQIMKIRIKSDLDELTMNQMIFRSFIANSILLNIINIVLLITMNKSGYIYTYGGFELVQYIITIVSLFMISNSRLVYFYGITTFGTIQYTITFVSIFMVLIRKDGRAIHDLLVKTRVVRE